MKILIADDHDLFLTGLQFVLNDFADNIVFVTAHSYTDIHNILTKENDFDLILTDLAMPGGNWQNEIELICKNLPETPVIILSAVFDKEIVQKTLDFGVSGYIPKTSSNAVILSAINLVLSGGIYIPPELVQFASNHQLEEIRDVLLNDSELKDKSKSSIELTPRQIDVLKLMAQGESNKQIAFELGLSEGTVKLHVTAILKLFHVFNRTSAVIEATKLGLFSDVHSSQF